MNESLNKTMNANANESLFGFDSYEEYLSSSCEISQDLADASFEDLFLEEIGSYFENHFGDDLNAFLNEIKSTGSSHTSNEIQYWNINPCFGLTDVIPKERRKAFYISLYWVLITNQVLHFYFRRFSINMNIFKYQPKFIGNCNGLSLMSSACGHHQHPNLLFYGVIDHMGIFRSEELSSLGFNSENGRTSDLANLHQEVEPSDFDLKKAVIKYQSYFVNRITEYLKYDSNQLSRRGVISKIFDEIEKGVYSQNPSKVNENISSSRELLCKQTRKDYMPIDE